MGKLPKRHFVKVRKEWFQLAPEQYYEVIDTEFALEIADAKEGILQRKFSRSEECLASVLEALAYAKFKHDLAVDPSKRTIIRELVYIYTVLSREFFSPSNLDKFFLDHLRSRWQKNKRKQKPLLSPDKMRQILSQESALPSEVAILFEVERRQVRRWIKHGLLTKGADGRIPRNEYLRFSKESSLKKYGREDYGQVYRKSQEMKIDRRGLISWFELEAPDAPTVKEQSIKQSQQQPAQRKKGK